MAKKAFMDDFAKDVLSGKLPKEPPVRGPFGMAKNELTPERWQSGNGRSRWPVSARKL